VKTTKKLEIKKVTLRNLDQLTLDAVAGGILTPGLAYSYTACATGRFVDTCPGYKTCA
jgi:hypothetical protein